MRILVVDGSESSRGQIEGVLRQLDCEPGLQAASASEAVDFLRFSNEPDREGGIDVILMTAALSDTDGIEAIRLIRAKESNQNIPIIFLCGKEDRERVNDALEAGAVDFAGIPAEKVELLARIRAALRLKEEIDLAQERESRVLMLIGRLNDANEKIQHLTNVDGLTGASNLRYFEEIMENEWRRAIREYNSIALLLLNIDRFESYNEVYGHLRGDVCLKRIAGAIGASLHRPGDVLARYGGDEFVVLLPNTDHEGALKVAEQIREKIAGLAIRHASSEVGDVVSLSIGLAITKPVATTDPPALIAAAEEALAEARKLGGNQVGFSNINKPVEA